MKHRRLLLSYFPLIGVLFFFYAILFSAPVFAEANLSLSSTQFTAANGSRSYMDVGGVWNGTTEVTSSTGDTFSFTVANDPSATTAYELTLSVGLSAGFNYVNNTAQASLSGTGCGSTPSISGSQTGTTLNFSFSPSSYALAAGCSLTVSYGLTTAITVVSGTYALTPTYNYSDTDGGALNGPQTGSQSILVQAGATTLTITPNNQVKAPTQTATFTPSICNTGLGGLFAVTLDESAINPNSANSLQVTSVTQTAPATPVATGSSPILTLPYLAPGTCFTATVNATVTGCASIINAVSTTDRTGATSTTTSASVQLDLQTPLISFSPPGLSVPASTSTNFSMTVSNTNLGAATQVALGTNLASTPAVVSNVSAGWTYNASSGTFTYIGGTLSGSSNTTLSFDVSQNQCPPASNSYNFVWLPSYQDGCGNNYAVPSAVSALNFSGGINPITLQKSAPSRLNLGESGSWNLTVTPNSLSDLTSDPIQVVDTLPSTPTSVSVGSAPSGTSYSCPGGCGPGKVLTWTVSKASLAGGALTLPITFTAPTGACSAGTNISNTISTTANWGPSTPTQCTFTTSATSSTGLALTPGYTNTQSYNVSNGASGTSTFETGVADNGNGVRDLALGEGEFISYSNNITFGSSSTGTWAGSTYTDNFAGLSTQTLVSGTLKVSINGGASQSVPGGSITTSAGSLLVDLSFLSGGAYANSANVAGISLTFSYSTTVNDSDLGGNVWKSVTALATYTISGGGVGCGAGGTVFTQPLSYGIYRRAEQVNVSVPNTVEVCGPFPVTVTAASAFGDGIGPGWNTLLTQLTNGSYSYPTSQTPTYGGAFSGNITYSENGGANPTFTYGPTPLAQNSNGSATYNMYLAAGSSTTPAPVTAQINYDDTASQVSSPPRSFTASGSATPAVVRSASLSVVVTPSNLTVLSGTTQFGIYVVNGGDGTAYNATLTDVLPTGLTPDQAASNAINASYPVSVTGQTMSWNLGNMAPGASVQITLVADVGGACTIGANTNAITASWGCGGTHAQSVTSHLPNFSFPSGQIQTVHDSTSSNPSSCTLCDSGSASQDVLIIRNTGSTYVYNAVLSEVLNPSSTGIDIASGATYQVSTDGGSTWSSTGGPSGGSGTTAAPYTWDKTVVPALATLAPAGSGGISEVRVRFPLQVSQTANSGTPTLSLSASAVIACGNNVSSPGVAFPITIKKPNITLTKQGRNVTTSSAVGKTVYAKPGDTVEWQVSIANNGSLASQNMLFTETLPATGTTTATMAGTGFSSQPITSGTAVSIPSISASGGTSSYTISEVVGATCVNQNNTASTTWGCSATPPYLTSPSQNTDTAALVMSPSFSGTGITQQWNSLNGGRGEIQITVTNNGAYAQNISLTDTLFSNFNIDPTFTPTVTSTGNVSSVSVGGTASVPVFTFTGTLDHGANLVVKFRVFQTSNFDTATDPFNKPETVGNGNRPAAPVAGLNQVSLAFQDGCGNANTATNSTTLTPLTPYVGTTVSPAVQMVTSGTAYTFTYTLTNAGPSGSVADHITFTPNLGAGWTSTSVSVSSAGTGGSGGACGATCSSAQIGTLASGSSATITVTATANANGSALTMSGTTLGTLFEDDGVTSTGNHYSYEIAQAKVAGYSQSLSLVSTTENFTSGTNVAIGEDETWLLHVQWFGANPADASSGFTSITVRQSLPTGLGFVSYATTANNTVAITPSGNTPVTSSVVNFAVGDITPAAGGGIFEINLVTRALNISGNTNGTSLINNLGIQYTLYSSVLASNNSNDGFGGSQANLHSQSAVTVNRPTLTFTKLVRNVTTGSSFAATTNGNAGNALEYQVTIGNTGSAPAFGLTVNDTLSGKLNLVSSSSNGSLTTGLGGTIEFDSTNTPQLTTAGQTLSELDPSQSVTLTYQASVDSSANPLEALKNNASISGATLVGATGNETAPTGTAGSSSGEALLSSSSQATNNVAGISFSKSIISTAVNSDTSPNVYIGEQIHFEIPVVIPEGTTPSLVVSDSLPSGLELVSTSAVTFGSGISGCTSPVISPSSLPATGTPLALSWTFGTCTVAAGSTTAQKTITIDYVAQVKNVAANSNGTTLANNASFSYTGYTSTASQVTLTVQLPSLAVTNTASVHSGAVAGDLITYTVSAKNNGPAPAYDLNIVSTLPAGLSYVASSTNVTSGTAMGDPDISGQVLTWGRNQATPQSVNIAAGATFTYTFQVMLTDSVQPGQSLTTPVAFDYTTLPGAPGPNLGVAVGTAASTLGERDGSGTSPNNLKTSASDTTTVASSFSVLKTKSGDTLSPSGFRVGDTITYTLQVNVQKGTVDNFLIEDTLPAGLAFAGFTAISPASGAQGYTYTAPSGANAPTAGATGGIRWNLGTLTRAGTSTVGSLQLVYTAVVKNVGGIGNTPTTATLNNSALLSYVDGNSTTQTTSASVAGVSVNQPSLSLTKSLGTGQSSTVHEGDTVSYQATVTNSGNAPAYNIVVSDTLPVGMRTATPSTVSATLNGNSVTLSAPTYSSATGVLTWSLTDAQALNASSTLVINYTTTVDSSIGGGVTLTNGAAVTDYYSVPSSGSPPERRHYTGPAASTTSVSTPSPTDMGKTVNATTANIGDTLTFTLTVPNTAVNVNLFNVSVVDVIPAGLSVQSITNNAAAIGANATDTSSGNNVNVAFDEIGANKQATIVVTARVQNIAGNVNAVTKSNSASYQWAKTSGGALQPAITSPSVMTTLKEPTLTVAKVFKSQTLANAGQGLQAGDSITYTLSLSNTGTGPAYNISLQDTGDSHLITPVITADPDNPGTPTSAASGSNTIWSWSIAGPLAAGATYSFDVTFTLDPTVAPYENLVNTASATWTSNATANADTRDGSGGINNYSATNPSPVTKTTGSVTFTKTEASPAPGLYAVGQNVTYNLELDFISGQLKLVHFLDTLPAGLVFESATVSASNAQVTGGGTVAILSGPSLGATGALDFNLGNITSTGANPKVILNLVTRVQNVVGNVNTTALTNTANGQIDSPNSPGTPVTINALANPVVHVTEPKLVLGLDAPASVALAATGTFTARVNNLGTSSGYQPTLQVQLPTGMRSADPTALGGITAALSSASTGRNLSLTLGTDYTVAYASSTGMLTFTFTSGQSYVATTEVLTVTFPGKIDSGTANGTNLDLVGTITAFASQDQSGGGNSNIRVTSTTFGVGATGVANGAVGTNATDDAPTTVAAPVVTFTKAVNTTSSVPGATLTYSVVITNNGATSLSNVNFTDDMDASFAAGTLRNVTVTPSTGTLVVSTSGGVNSTGRISITGASVGVSSTVTIGFQVTLKSVIASNTTVKNQGSFTASGYATTFYSDSTNPNDLTTPDHSTRTQIASAPTISFTKVSALATPPPLAPLNTLTYTLVLTNSGNENVKNATLQDSIPSDTTYVAGSTTLNGAVVADIAGTAPFVASMPITGVGSTGGWVNVGTTATVTFQVTIRSGVSNGTAIRNQAKFNGTGEGSGTLTTKLSTDPRMSFSPAPTTDVVGSAPLLYAIKTVTDVSGAPTQVGHVLEYDIVIRNVGAITAHSLVFKDTAPTNTTYAPATIKFGAPGNGVSAAPVAQTDAVDSDASDFGGTATNAVTTKIGDLPSGYEARVSFQVTVNAGVVAGTVISNQGTVTSQELPPLLTDAFGALGSPPQPTLLVVGNVPQLAVTKSAAGPTGGIYNAGNNLRYTISLRNIGSATAQSVVLTDPLPPTPTTYVSSSTTQDGNAVADVSGASPLVTGLALGDIPAGGSSTVEAVVAIPTGTAQGTLINNTASYTATGLSGTAANTIQVGAAAGVSDLKGTVFLDLNHNQVQDPGEPGQPNWIIQVYFNGAVVGTATSDANGNYEVLGLQPGAGYEVRFVHAGNNAVYGGAVSTAVGATTEGGTIKNLTLTSGVSVLDQNLALDPSGVVYDSVTRLPVAGATINISGPAGFDPTTGLAAGQQGQVTASDGLYRFDLQSAGAPSGTYTISITPPNGYLPFPSTMIAPQAGSLAPGDGPPNPYPVVASNAPPVLGAPSTYYISFTLNPSDPGAAAVVNNHIPLDPILKGALTVTKTTPLQNVSVGGLVPYTIAIKNNTSSVLSNINLVDTMPPGFKFVTGSAKVLGQTLTPQVAGRVLTFANLTFTANENKLLKLVLIVGSGVADGLYTNDAVAINNIANTEVSNHGQATVRIVPDPTFDCPDIIGKVFDDKNRNGNQDDGEKGLPGVRLATARGWLVNTDEYGRFHIACPVIPDAFRGSNFILKVDERTLPTGYRVTTENPHVVHLTRGKLAKVNFGATIDRVVRLEVRDNAFEKGKVDLRPEWQDKLSLLIPTLREKASVVRIAYWAAQDDHDLVKRRLAKIRSDLLDLWKKVEEKKELQIESELSWKDGRGVYGK